MKARHKRQYAPTWSPDRCQGISKNGEQCVYLVVPGTKYCSHHLREKESDRVRMYLVTKWKSQIDRFANHDQLYSLAEEIGVTRLMIETQLQRATDEDELLMRQPQIAQLLQSLEKLLNTSLKAEEKMKTLLSLEAVRAFANAVVTSVTNATDTLDLEDKAKEDFLESVADQIEEAMEKLRAS